MLRLRYITLTGFAVALLVVASLALSGRIPSVMDVEISEYYLLAQIEYPPGTPFEIIDDQVVRLEEIAKEIRAELNAELGMGSAGDPSGDSFQHIISILDENVGAVDIEIAIDERVRPAWMKSRKAGRSVLVNYLPALRYLFKPSGRGILVCLPLSLQKRLS